ncbi:hypothetical protein AAFF_G00192870 [Aldrovandia affinis]|uniref:Uncharacterized protein n=1 Tax=Aldrovandia affinis TaxID=143900 RepID=A0AAD7R0M5_9TELE|nr:hypothetical protein AAFF_G00192870 [Aldrovandia affinis]
MEEMMIRGDASQPLKRLKGRLCGTYPTTVPLVGERRSRKRTTRLSDGRPPFGASSSPGCANFGLKYLARQHKDDYPSASAFIEKNFYVDDGLTSVPSIEEAKKLIVEAQELCKEEVYVSINSTRMKGKSWTPWTHQKEQ